MTKESGSHNIGISRKIKGVLDFPDGKRLQGLGKNGAKPEISVIFFDGIKLVGLTKLRKEILQLLIDRSLNGESVSKTELKEIYEADGVHKAGKDSIADFIVRLNELLRKRNLDYVIKNLTSSREKQQGIEARYLFTTKEDQQKQPTSLFVPELESEAVEADNAETKPHENKIKLSEETKKKIGLKLAINVLSPTVAGQTNKLNGLVNIHMYDAALSYDVDFRDMFGEDISQDQIKESFIKILDSVMRAYWDSNTKNIDQNINDPEEIKLVKQFINLKNPYYTREGIIRELRRYFGIPVPEKYISHPLQRSNS